jgi:hypothetical protein
MPMAGRRLEWALGCAAVAALLASACLETKRALGEDCLKDGDCQSGVCSQLRCGAVPVTTNGKSEAPQDAASEAPADSSPGLPVDSDGARD